METALALLTAGLASLAIVPVMMRLAPRLGLIDEPAARKVHTYPIPRVGGWGIAAGVVTALLVWGQIDQLALAYLWGIVVLFLFGAWDDRRELGHYVKFGGQVLALLPLILIAGLYLTRFPFIDPSHVPVWAAILFTVFAMIGMTNAINHSDGLDGLAGGESILSLVAFAFLAHHAGGSTAVLISVAMIGGVFGFLRYNTHPAVVFMGDSGSQVIGFSLATLAVMLVERVDLTISPFAVILLLGLPVADILFVLYRRAKEGRNWFRATKNHVHHRLIERRFTHPEAVVIIYGIQIVFVGTGLLFRHSSDWLLAGLYLAGCTVVFGGLRLAERFDWFAPRRGEERGAWRWLGRGVRRRFLLVEFPRRILELGLPTYLVVLGILVPEVPSAAGYLSAVLGAVLWLASIKSLQVHAMRLRRAGLLCAAALAAYVSFENADAGAQWIHIGERVFLGVMALAVAIAIRYSPGRRRGAEFKTTGLDVLIVLVVITAMLAIGWALPQFSGVAIALLILLYSIEVLTSERRERPSRLVLGVSAFLVLIATKGLFL